MKDFLKCMGLLWIGVFVAISVYQCLHEVGHLVVALIVGVKVIDFSILPLPYVECEATGIEEVGIVLIGLAGLFFSVILSITIHPKSFGSWYAIC